jgi:predicted metal-dependent hydrolase
MQKITKAHTFQDIEFKITFSRRRTLAISVLPDSTVVVRVPFRTPVSTINRIVSEKEEWIRKHRDSAVKRANNRPDSTFADGGVHLFRGSEYILRIRKSGRNYVRFFDGTVEMGLEKTEDHSALKRLMYEHYKDQAVMLFPELLNKMVDRYNEYKFKPTGLVIRTMKRRWGSCSSKGKITLSTELIKLPDLYIEYVIVHELCHLKHHNHGTGFYNLLSELFPEWKQVRKQMKMYVST